MLISKEFKFEMAHKLFESYTSKCMNLHGHSYRAVVNLEGNTDSKSGVVVDFTQVKEQCSYLFEMLDHNCVVYEKDVAVVQALQNLQANRHLAQFMVCSLEPTAENIALWLASEISRLDSEDVALHSVEVYETATSKAVATTKDLTQCKIPEMKYWRLK